MTYCTLLNPAALQLNASLPSYPAPGAAAVAATGAALRLSQAPCVNADGSNNASCCASGSYQGQATRVCSHWSGAHITGVGCLQYGVLEVEVAPPRIRADRIGADRILTSSPSPTAG